MLRSKFKSLEIVSNWMKDFINRLIEVSPGFSFPESEISNLALALQDLETLLDQLKAIRPDQKIAAAEKNKSVKNALTTATALIDRLKKDPNWTNDWEKILKIHTLPLKADSKVIRRTSRTGIRFYTRNECFEFMAWIKDFSHELTKNDTLFEVYRTAINDLLTGIEKAENALNNHNSCYTRWTRLSEKADASALNLRAGIRTVVKRLKASGDWTDEHTLFLGVDDDPIARNLTNYKPVARLKVQVRHVGVHFLKNDLDGMNVYSRLQGELDFSFLGYAKRSPYKDPRPLISYTTEIREYRLTAVVAGKEIGQPGDSVSIQIGGKSSLKPVARISVIDGYAYIHFQIKGKKGMNIYTREHGESAFTFLSRSTDACFRDPRALIPGEHTIREYRLNFIWAHTNKEIGYPSDIVSIKLD